MPVKTATLAPLLPQVFAGGIPAAEFNAIADHLQSTAPVANTTYTICCWSKWTGAAHTGSGVTNNIFSLENTAGTAYHLHTLTPNANTIECHDNTQGGFLFGNAQGSGSAGWFFNAETNDQGTDTELCYRAEGAGSLTKVVGNNYGALTPTRFYISSYDAAFWTGPICMVRIWSAVLTQAELLAESRSPVPVRTSGLWASYALNPSNILLDDSGNARHLTNPGAAGVWGAVARPSL